MVGFDNEKVLDVCTAHLSQLLIKNFKIKLLRLCSVVLVDSFSKRDEGPWTCNIHLIVQ